MPNDESIQANEQQWSHLFRFLIYLVRMRRWLLVHFVLSMVAATVIAFLIPKSYSSSLTFLPPEGGGGIGLSGLLSGMEGLSTGGHTVVSADQVRSIFEGEQLQRRLIADLHLERHYKIDTTAPGRIHKTRRALAENLELASDEQMGVGLSSISAFTIKCTDESPDTAALIVRHAFKMLDSAIRETNVEQARRNRVFLESQLDKRLKQMREEQGALTAFQKKTKIYNASAQAEASLKSASELRARLIEQQTLASMIRNSDGPASSKYAAVQAMISALKTQLANLETKNDADVLPGLNRGADLSAEYLQLYSYVEISSKVVFLLSQQLEMYRLDESRLFSSMSVVSDAQIADYKSAPKRVLVILLLVVGEHLFLLLLLALRYMHIHQVRHTQAWSTVRDAWRGRA